MNSCSTGLVALLPNQFSRTTHLHKNGDKTGAFRSMAGAQCARTIFNGGANGSVLPGGSFIYSGSITLWDFIAFMLFRGGPRGTKNSYLSISSKCLNEPVAAHRILLPATTTRRKIARRISAKVKNTCALFWKKPAQRVWPEKIWASYPNTCGRICALLVSQVSKFPSGKSAMGWSFPAICTTEYQSQLTQHMTTNRFALCGMRPLSIRNLRQGNKRTLHSRRSRSSRD